MQLAPEENGQCQECGVHADEHTPVLINDTYIGGKDPAIGDKQDGYCQADCQNQKTHGQFLQPKLFVNLQTADNTRASPIPPKKRIG